METEQLQEIQSILEKNGVKNKISNKDTVSVECALNGQSLEVKFFFEPANFQINVGNAVLDKVEDVNLKVADVSSFLDNFSRNLTHEGVSLVEYKFLGLKSYSVELADESDIKHSAYQTFTELIVQKLGTRHDLGTVIPSR